MGDLRRRIRCLVLLHRRKHRHLRLVVSPRSQASLETSAFLIAINLIMWIVNATLHVIMAPRLVCHINSKPKLIKKCPLKRRVGMPEMEYQDACRKIFEAVKAKKGAPSAEADDELAL